MLNERLVRGRLGWEFYPHDPLVRRIHHMLADCVLEPDSVVHGVEHIAAVAAARWSSLPPISRIRRQPARGAAAPGREPMSDRLTVIAGPKVYSSEAPVLQPLLRHESKRRKAPACPSEDAVMNPREVARAARRSIEAAHERIGLGDALLVFAEGTRSRSNGMQQLLTGVTRYLELPDTWILPVGLVGSEALFPIGDETVHSVRVVGRVGAPIKASELEERSGGDRRVMMDAVGAAIAQLLPPEYRGACRSR